MGRWVEYGASWKKRTVRSTGQRKVPYGVAHAISVPAAIHNGWQALTQWSAATRRAIQHGDSRRGDNGATEESIKAERTADKEESEKTTVTGLRDAGRKRQY